MGRMAAVSFTTATGTITSREVNDRGEARDDSISFAFRRPDSLRIDGPNGPVMIVTSERRLMRDRSGNMQLGNGSGLWGGPGNPRQMLGGREAVENLSGPDDFSAPAGPGEPVQMAGRPAWRFVLTPPPHKDYPLAVVIDDATAAVLEFRSIGIDNYTTLTDFVPDAPLAENLFDFDGIIATDLVDQQREREEVSRLGRERSWPTPKYWPRGPDLMLMEADGKSGAFFGRLPVSGNALLGRWEAGSDQPLKFTSYTQHLHVHRWTADGFDWGLAVEDAFTDDELARVIDSISVDE